MVAFDEARERLLSLPEAVPERRTEIVALLVGRAAATRQTGLVAL